MADGEGLGLATLTGLPTCAFCGTVACGGITAGGPTGEVASPFPEKCDHHEIVTLIFLL